jgi:hypothetical protein
MHVIPQLSVESGLTSAHQRGMRKAKKQSTSRSFEKVHYHSPDSPDEDLPITKKIKTEQQVLEPLFRDCCICMDSFDDSNFPRQKITTACSHRASVCLSCLTQSIDTQIPDVAWDHIKCLECSKLLPFDVVKTWASNEMFERYRKNTCAVYQFDL